jgi:hypothetical protein
VGKKEKIGRERKEVSKGMGEGKGNRRCREGGTEKERKQKQGKKERRKGRD